MIGFKIRGTGQETISAAEVLAACERYTSSLTHFGTEDFVHLICSPIPATKHPDREISNYAARLIDDERARQFEAARYFRMPSIPYEAYQLQVTHIYAPAYRSQKKLIRIEWTRLGSH
jgi:hypothetical protein